MVYKFTDPAQLARLVYHHNNAYQGKGHAYERMSNPIICQV